MNFFEKYTGKTGNELFQDAASAAKARLASAFVKKQAQDEEVQADIKAGVGQEIGVFLIDNGPMIAGVLAALGLVWFVARRK